MSTPGAFAKDKAKYYRIILGDDVSVSGKVRVWLTCLSLRCVACYRFGQASSRLFERNRLLGLVPWLFHKIWNRHTVTKYHIDISRRAAIGAEVFLPHYHGIIIGPVEIGDNCVIYQNVTIGERVALGDHGLPRIGSCVWIGPGAVITGGVTIGDNVTISAGCILSRDVPANCLVAGNPGRVVMQDYDNAALIGKRVSSTSPTASSPASPDDRVRPDRP